MLNVALAGGMLAGLTTLGAHAQTVFDSWSSVAIPPAPELQPVTVDAQHTALLILDVNADACSHRPSCVRSMPHMQHVLADARAHHMFVVYSTSASAPGAPVPEPLSPMPNDLSVSSSADKFLGTDLEKILASRGIKTVIVVGTTAQGAVLYTASAAALRKLAVVVPVDGYSSDTPFAELVTAWLLKNAPVSVSAHVTLTRTDMITVHDASPPEKSAPQSPAGRDRN
jgi:nicotinamidase-related amidase